MTKTDAPMHVESTTYHGQVHGDKPFNADEWLQKAGAAVDHATLCAKLSGGTFASAHEWWEAREVASTAELTVVALLVAAHGRLVAAEKLAGAHVDTRAPGVCNLCNSPVDCARRGTCAEGVGPVPPLSIEPPVWKTRREVEAETGAAALLPPAGYRMTPKHTKPYAAFRAAGWTDAQMLQCGYLKADVATAIEIGSPVDAVSTLKALGYFWAHGRWCPPVPTRSVLNRPLGVLVRIGDTSLGEQCLVRELVEYAEEQHNRAKRLTEAGRRALAGFPRPAPGTALSDLARAVGE